MISLAGGIPAPGTAVRSGDVVLEVIDATARAVRSMRVRREARPVDVGGGGI